MSNLSPKSENNSPSSPPTKAPGLLSIFEKSPKRLKRINFLSRLFADAKFELRIAGGAVRDVLRGVEPQDIDFATTARPEQTLELFQKHEDIFRIIVTAAGQKHGTVAIKFKEVNFDLKKVKLDPELEKGDTESKAEEEATKPQYDEEAPFEITTLRCDVVTDGRHAEVQFVTDWQIDAERRDLTINAMFLTLDEGKLVDFFDGESDLRNGIVRFVGDANQRIQEDYLRILRFFRFWSRYNNGNQPEPSTLEIIRQNLGGLDNISGERLWTEMKKIMSTLPCQEVLKHMLELNLMIHLGLKTPSGMSHEEFTKETLKSVEQIQQFTREYSNAIMAKNAAGKLDQQMMKKIKDLFPVIIFATMIRNFDMLSSCHIRLKFSNVEKESIALIVEQREKEVTIERTKMLLALAKNQERPIILARIRALLIFRGEFTMLETLESWEVPDFPLEGKIVTQAASRLKLHPRVIKDTLNDLRHEWVKSNYELTNEELVKAMESKLDDLSQIERNKLKLK